MKIQKTLLSIALALIPTANINADVVTLHTPTNFQVLSLSPNGKWACGVFIDAALETYGFRWNLESGSIEMLSIQPSTAWDVSNDGTVSGDFRDSETLPNKAPISMPGFWRDGKWHHLETPSGTITDGFGGGISADGRYMTGTICVNGIYTPYIWDNGALSRSLATDNHAVSYAVSPDGQLAAGFSTKTNRTACLWGSDGLIYFEDSQVPQSPWNYSRNFSPDGSKLLYWGGWEVEDSGDIYLYSVYDINTGERERVKSPSLESDLEYFDISNSGMLVGYNQSRGYIHTAEGDMYVDDYLASRGVDLSTFEDFYSANDYYVGQLPIQKLISVSEDENVFAALYYNTIGESASMIIKIDQNTSEYGATEVKGLQLSGLNTVSLTWKRQVGANAIRGYNVYRDGKKLNGILPINVPYYYDKNLKAGTYEYIVAAVNSSGKEIKCEPVSVTVSQEAPEQPLDLYGRQKGINGLYATWQQPLSNLVHKRYYDIESDAINGISIYMPLEVEMAVKFDKTELAQYTGYKLSEVSFMPMAENEAWAINAYTLDADGKLQLIATQTISQELKYRQLNTIKLDQPIDLPAGDLILAIDVLINEDSELAIGAQNGKSLPGYSDLMRVKGEDDEFYSAFDASTSSGYSVSSLSWAIDLGLEKDGYSADDNALTHYNVYVDGDLACSTDANAYEGENMADGTHAVAVEAVYANGEKSLLAATEVKIAAKYKSVDDLMVDTGAEGQTTVTASWSAPVNDDATPITYSTDARHSHGIKGVSSNAYAIMVAADYPSAMMHGYEGYRVKNFKFYPLADALFTFILYANGTLVYELEVDDFEIGKWNTIEVPDDVLIEANTTYRLVLDSFDPEPDVELIAIDNDMPRSYISDLYSIDNGDTWNSLTYETGASGNWMLGMEISTAEPMPSGVLGYDVVVDSKVCNESIVTDTEYSYDFGEQDNKLHSVRIDTHYDVLAEPIRGEGCYFHLNVAGIADGVIADIRLQREANYLKAEGAKALTIYDTAGMKVAASEGDTVSISMLSAGIYVVQINTGITTINQKINIK